MTIGTGELIPARLLRSIAEIPCALTFSADGAGAGTDMLKQGPDLVNLCSVV